MIETLFVFFLDGAEVQYQSLLENVRNEIPTYPKNVTYRELVTQLGDDGWWLAHQSANLGGLEMIFQREKD